MSKSYKAVISIEFDDDDIEEWRKSLGASERRFDLDEALFGELQNFPLGSPWIERIEERKKE
jgi:hypothetical protein